MVELNGKITDLDNHGAWCGISGINAGSGTEFINSDFQTVAAIGIPN
jgi:hypothetical protein